MPKFVQYESMQFMVNHPRVLSLICLVAMWAMSLLGVWIRTRSHVPENEDRDNLGIVLSATLTLLGLIIGFTFSMATLRYDQRRLYEEGEANAIGTEYVRADLLPAPEAVAVRHLLLVYLDWRIQYYQTDYGDRLTTVDAKTAGMQTSLWRAVLPQAAAQPTPVTALVVSGMNDVLNSQGYTQFSWWNRIPPTAWDLMVAISLVANILVGYATKRSRSGNLLLLVMPALIAISFFLISDIDSPRGGIIRIPPRDLISLSQSLHHPG
jgi:hypothetical protein